MELIVSNLVEVMKRETSILSRERKLMIFLYQIIVELVSEAFQRLDLELAQAYKEKGYKIDRRVERTIVFLFGSITFRRRRMVNEDGEVVYPLDKFLGIRERCRFSSLVLRNVSELSSRMVYRHVSKAITLLTPFSASHQFVRQVAVYTGKLIKNRETAETRYDEVIEPRKVNVLYLEGDGVRIRGKNKKKLEVHRFQVHEGVNRSGKRNELVNSYFISSMKRRDALKEMIDYVQNTYDLTSTLVISNSDGGSGYEKTVFDEIALGCGRHEHFRDSYHVNRKLKERLNFVPQLHGLFHEAIRLHDLDKLRVCFDTAESLIDPRFEDQQMDQLEKLQGYLARNWEYLKTLSSRDLPHIPRCIGICESGHRRITYRMKKQGRYWSEEGAEAMVRIIDSLRNGTIDRWLNGYFEEERDQEEQNRQWKRAQRFAHSKEKFEEHEGVFHGRIANYGPCSNVWGKLGESLKSFE